MSGDATVSDEVSQSKLLPDSSEESEQDAVYVVASNYDGDPHPHIEGVWRNKEQAEAMMEKCRDRFSDPHPVAWDIFEVEIGDEEVNDV